MSDTADVAKREWVLRVLGFDVAAATAGATDTKSLTQRLQKIGARLQEMKAAGAPALAELLPLFRDANTAVKEGSGSAIGLLAALEEKADAWVPPPPIDFDALVARWRDARQIAAQNIAAVASGILGLGEVRADPRFPQVEPVVRDLPKMMPVFDGRLDDILLAAKATPARPGIRDAAAAAIKDYRSQIAAVPELAKIEDFAARNLGSFPLNRALEEAMQELENALAKAA